MKRSIRTAFVFFCSIMFHHVHGMISSRTTYKMFDPGFLMSVTLNSDDVMWSYQHKRDFKVGDICLYHSMTPGDKNLQFFIALITDVLGDYYEFSVDGERRWKTSSVGMVLPKQGISVPFKIISVYDYKDSIYDCYRTFARDQKREIMQQQKKNQQFFNQQQYRSKLYGGRGR